MKIFYTVLSAFIAAISLSVSTAGASQYNASNQASSDVSIQKLAWMLGSWSAENDQQTIDEQWSLQAESLLGISRTMEAGKSKAFELLLIEKQGDDFILRLRFFGPSIDKATRGKENPLRLKVIQADEQILRCEGIDSELGTSLIYSKLSATTMQAQISKVREGKIVWQESYQFTRVPQ